MVSKKLQKKWEREADEKYAEHADILKIFSAYYGPTLIATFFSLTEEKAKEIIGARATKTRILGLFTEAWRLAIKKSLPPCGENDFLSLLSEAAIIWEKNGCKGARIKTLRRVWRKV